jgi:transcriptional regulator with XRE-family HTH domain
MNETKRLEFNGQGLRAARLARGWSMGRLARELERVGVRVARQQVLAWEQGQYAPAGVATVSLGVLFPLEVFLCLVDVNESATPPSERGDMRDRRNRDYA